MNRKMYESNFYPSITFRIWDHSCAVGMHFRPEWPDHLPRSPIGLILVLDVTNVPLFRTIRAELSKLLDADHLRNCPTLVLLNKSDIPTEPSEFLTIERVQRDLKLHDLLRKGFKTFVLRTNKFSCENLNQGLAWLDTEINKGSTQSQTPS